MFPGLSSDYLRVCLNLDGLKAIVIESYGAGNMQTNSVFIDFLRDAAHHLHIVNVSQCLEGVAEETDYLSSHISRDLGIIHGKDMTFEAALCRARVILGKTPDLDYFAFKQTMQTNLHGEITQRSPS